MRGREEGKGRIGAKKEDWMRDKREERGRASRERGSSRGRSRGKGKRGGRKAKGKGGSIGEREGRREGICRARAVPSQSCARNRRRQRKTRNSQETHNRGLGNGETNAS